MTTLLWLVILFDERLTYYWLGDVGLRAGRRRGPGRHWYTPEAINPRQPVIVEGRVHDTTVTRGMIETFLINHDADVTQIAEENQRAEFELFILRRRLEHRPV